MARRKSDDSKLVDIHFRESFKRKKKLEEYAALNRVSLTQYIRGALDIRDIMTRNEFNLSDTDDVFDEHYEESEEEDDDEYD